MSWEKHQEFYSFIIENRVIGFYKKPIKLKSGRISNWYVNWRNVAADVFLLDKLTDYILNFIDFLKLQPDCFYGVPEGASKLGIITQFKWAKRQKNYNPGKYVLSMGRGKPKEHGDPNDQFFLGVPNGNVVVLEDTTTTGGSLISTIRNLKDLNINVIAAVGLTNRNEIRNDGRSVEEIISEESIEYYALSNALELLPKLNPEKQHKNDIEDYFKKYGVKKIRFS